MNDDYKKKDPKEHYRWPLRRVKTVVRKGRQHTDMLSCGHTHIWRGSSSYKDGETPVSGVVRTRRCQACYAEEQQRIDEIFATNRRKAETAPLSKLPIIDEGE